MKTEDIEVLRIRRAKPSKIKAESPLQSTELLVPLCTIILVHSTVTLQINTQHHISDVELRGEQS